MVPLGCVQHFILPPVQVSPSRVMPVCTGDVLDGRCVLTLSVQVRGRDREVRKKGQAGRASAAWEEAKNSQSSLSRLEGIDAQVRLASQEGALCPHPLLFLKELTPTAPYWLASEKGPPSFGENTGRVPSLEMRLNSMVCVWWLIKKNFKHTQNQHNKTITWFQQLPTHGLSIFKQIPDRL